MSTFATNPEDWHDEGPRKVRMPSKKPEIASRLAELEAKAKRAGELKSLLDELADADPYKNSLALREVLTESTLRKVIAIGVETLRKQTDDELTALLGK